MLSKSSFKFFSAFLTLLLAGAFLGNLILIYVSLIPLLTVIFALTVNQPSKISIKRVENKLELYVDDVATISFRAEISDGVGIVTLADKLPKYFKLVEGNNFRVLWKGFKKKIIDMSYKVECTKRGVYQIGPINWEAVHPLLMRQTKISAKKEFLQLTVRHKPLFIKRVIGTRTFSKIPLPSESQAKMGVVTTDFREIRDYIPGDPYRSINWKATARSAHSLKPWLPKVNEFEKEGKRVVWIFLDKSASTISGPETKSSFEYAVQAATALARFYLERDCKVGLCVYGSAGAERIVFPDVGNRQYYKIMKDLTALEPESIQHYGTYPNGSGSEEKHASLKSAVARCRRYLMGTNPLSIIITSISPKNAEALIEGIKDIRKYSMSMRIRPSKVILIHLMGNHIAARNEFEEIAADLLELRNSYVIEKVRIAGAQVVSWNPLRHSFEKLLFRGLRAS